MALSVLKGFIVIKYHLKFRVSPENKNADIHSFQLIGSQYTGLSAATEAQNS